MINFTVLSLTFYLLVLLLFSFYLGRESFWKRSENRRFTRFHRYKNAQKLQQILSHLIVKRGSVSKDELPQYKFYTSLVETLLELSKTFGTGIQKPFRELKLGVRREILFDQKVFEQLKGGIIQAALISLLAWLFYFMAQLFIGLSLDMWQLSVIIILQLSGFMVFVWGFSFFEKRTFSSFTSYFHRFYLFQSLIMSGLPISLIFEKVDLDSLPVKKELNGLKERMRDFFVIIKQVGRLDLTEVTVLKEELWDQLEMSSGQFVKKMTALKLAILFLFFVPSYLSIVFFMLSSILKR